MKISKHIKNKGFALISTLSIMSLLVMLAIGMMSLATTESKVANATKYEMEAKANARMALMIALGELQEAMGPDQRISATSNILDTNQATEDIDGVVSQNVLGVWDSWNTYITDPLDSSHPSAPGDKIQQSYEDGRAPLFKKWLVSHDNESEKEDWEAARKGFQFDDDVLMVGEGSMGSSDSTGYVQAGKISVMDVTGNDTGAYAWWVGGENLKADLGVASDRAPSSGGDGLATTQSNYSAAKLIDPSESIGFQNFTEEAEDRRKLISSGQIGLEASDTQLAKESFFDFTSGSSSVLADVRRGGIKHDLNLLFENDTFPSEFKDPRTTSWNSAVTVDPTIRELDGEVSIKGAALTNPHTTLPSWNKMRAYYRLYRSVADADGDSGVLWDGGGTNSYPYIRSRIVTQRLGDFNTGRQAFYPDYAGYTRVPLVMRHMYLLGLTRQINGTRVAFRATTVPVMVLWNPYNVELRYGAGDFLGDIANNYMVRLSYRLTNKPDGSGDDTSWTRLASPDTNAWQEISVKNQASDAIGDEITLKPGELVMVSVKRVAEGDEVGLVEAARGLLNNLSDPLLGGSVPIVEYDQSLVGETGGPEIELALGHSGVAQTIDRFGAAPEAFGLVFEPNGTLGTEIISDEDGEAIDAGPDVDNTVNAYGVICNWSNRSVTGNVDGAVTPIVTEPAVWAPGNQANFIGVIQVAAKSAEQMADGIYPSGDSNNGVDFRNKTWLHAAPIHPTHINNLSNPIAKTNFPYVLHYQQVTGPGDLGNLLNVEPDGSTYMGGGYGSATGVPKMSVLEIPTAPITSLSGFATMRMRPSTVKSFDTTGSGRAAGNYNAQWKAAGFHSASFALGVGNGYAHPMVPENDIIQSYRGADWTDKNGFVNRRTRSVSNSQNDVVATDYWDQLLLTNDALYDNWFCSAVVPETTAGEESKNLRAVMNDFLQDDVPLANERYRPYLPEGMDSTAVENEIFSAGGEIRSDAHEKVGSFMMMSGGFNVNSTSVEAWKGLLNGLKKTRAIVHGADDKEINVEDGGDSELVVSRFGWAPTNSEGSSAQGDEAAWTGIRKLTETHINKLAEEIVHQVKLRGPFLNMSEFINRRIGDTNDSRLNQAGTLQAAIDWDEFAKGYNGAGDTGNSSINGRFKNAADDMLSDVTVAYPNITAARGSRHSGIPGYVMASDILRSLGDVLVVRDDTFTIRAYGESKDAQGNVKAKAWCEAKVQRYPEYVEHKTSASGATGNFPWEQFSDKLGGDAGSISAENKKYGRKMRVVSFRWLSPNEI